MFPADPPSKPSETPERSVPVTKRQDVSRADVRLPDERPRLRADQRPAGVAGPVESPDQSGADVLVFNTCTIREKADDRFVAHLMDARAAKQHDPEKRDRRRRLLVGVDEGRPVQTCTRSSTWPSGRAPSTRLGDYISAGGEVPRGPFSTFDRFAGHLPAQARAPSTRPGFRSRGAATRAAAYCIVARGRGREQSLLGDLVDEAARLAGDGVRELTLHGQNVNSWGRDLPPAPSARPSATCCAASTPWTGSHVLRFTTRTPRTCAPT